MYLEADELKTNMYSHVIDQITQGDDQIVAQAIEAAIEEVASYLCQRYDTDKIFGEAGKDRNMLILENVKVVAVWQLIKLSNAELLYEVWEGRYDRVIKYLDKVQSGAAAPRLPLKKTDEGTVVIRAKFGSNPKFTHE